MACPNCIAECYNTHNSNAVIQDPITKEWKDFKACPRCAVLCHHVYKHKKSTTAKPLQFFKVLVGDFSTVLHLPPAFLHRFGGNKSHHSAFLEGPYGGHWHVDVGLTDRGMFFQKGWDVFVSEHRLELGDFILFKHFGEMCFKVLVFDKSCCERTNMPALCLTKQPMADSRDANCQMQGQTSEMEQNATDNLNHASTSTKSEAIETVGAEIQCRETKSNCIHNLMHKTYQRRKAFLTKGLYMTKAGFTRVKSLEIENRGRQYVQSYFSRRRPVTEAERKIALEEAQKFQSDNPFVLMVMKKSHVYQGFWLSFPRDFSRKWLPRSRLLITLIGPLGKQRKVKYLGDRKNPGLSAGWCSFAIDNNLEEGDICIFELETRNKCILKVHIFRVVENVLPRRV